MYRSEHGFTLVELLTVITIMGVAAAVAIPDMSTTNINRLNLAAEEIAEAIRYARSEAIRTGEPHGFNQQSSAKRIRVFHPDTSVSPWSPVYDVYHPIGKKLYEVDLNTHPFAAAGGLSEVVTFRATCNKPGEIYFNNNGIPYCSDPETVLLEQFAVTLTLDKHQQVVTLKGITGRVTIQ